MTSVDSETIAFIQLKVACNQIMQAPCKESIEGLFELLNKVPSSPVQNMHSHLLFVLMELLQQKQLRSEVKIQVAECMKTILSQVKLSSDEPILDSLLFCLMRVIYSPESENLVAENPEELTLGCIKCLSLLLTQAKPKHRVQLYSPKRASILGVLVCICLKQASGQQYRALKVAAIECLMACGQVLESEQVSDLELRLQTANVFMNFLPGIAAGLKQVICADEKQGHAITVVAVRAWGRLLAQVLDEEALSPEPLSSISLPSEISKCIPGSLSLARTSAELEHLMLKNQRSAAWFSHADSKLVGNVQAVCAVHQHSHFKVRLEMVDTAQLLLTKCSRAVPQCMPSLLEVLVALSEDEEVQVASAAEEALRLVSLKCEGDSSKSLTEVLEESFFTLASELPAIFNHADARQQRSGLGLLLGYLRLLGPRLPEALLLAPHCEALLQGLLQAATLDCGTVLLLSDCALRDLSSGESSRPWCRFRHFSDAEVQSRLSRVCCLLGELADLPLLCGQLVQIFKEHPAQRREAAFLLNQILSIAYPGKETEQFGVVRAVLRAYLDPEVWEVPLSVLEHSTSQNLTLAAVRGNVVQACLLTEGIATLTVGTGSLARRVLAQVLYPVLERAGSSLELVSGAGRLALGQLASCLGHASIAQLIKCEADYFVHTVEMKLRRPCNNPGALLVLSAILAHSSRDVLPCIHQLVSNVLVRSCDTVQERSLTAYLQVFHTFVLSVQKWLDEEREGEKRNQGEEGKKLGGQHSVEGLLVKELRLHQKWKLATGEESNEEEDSEKDAEGSAPESKETIVPNYVIMTEAVMFRCVHALPSQDREKQLIALSTLNIGVQILAQHEDQLLPMVHRIWSPLLQRFSQNQDIVVLRQSFELLCTMAHFAKNFLRNRALDKVLPSITRFLLMQSVETRKQRCQLYSQSVKLQRVALDRLGGLAADLELQEEHLDLVLASAAPYLSGEQPPALQESCLGLFRSLARLSPDLVWLHLRALWNPEHELLPPHPSCPVIRLPRSTLDTHHFKKNVELLQIEV